MTDRWSEIDAIVSDALAIDPPKRILFITEVCGTDQELAREVLSLLKACEASDGFLEQPGLAGFSDEPLVAPSAYVPDRVAGYRIIRVLGTGGMGIVYLAEQERPRRQVALKVIRSGFGDATAAKRFETEVEVLGRLRHPGIAQVYEAGTADGAFGPQAFLAMELIQDVTITAWAASKQLGVPERLILLAKVCDAVQYAHDNGVVHRDLKPSNILVDETGDPKVLDFGIARVVRSGESTATLQTQAGQVLGTLAYMSPEQASGQTSVVGVSSDVYSLGVLGYELLCGRLPVEIAGKSIQQCLTEIQLEDPPRLGTINGELRGDVETVICKALLKHPSQRYLSAGAFAMDLRRIVCHQPISARPQSAAYHLSKFARRHRGLVGAAVAAFAVLVCAVILLTIQNGRLSTARENAESAARSEIIQRQLAVAESGKLRESISSLQSLFRVGVDGGGKDVRIVDTLDRFGASLTVSTKLDPSLLAFRHQMVGAAYRRIGELGSARIHLVEASRIRNQLGDGFTRDNVETAFELEQLDVDSGERLPDPDRISALITRLSGSSIADQALLLAMRARLAWTLLVRHRPSEAVTEARYVISHLVEQVDLYEFDVVESALDALVGSLFASDQADSALAEIRGLISGMSIGNPSPGLLLALRCHLADGLIRQGRPQDALEVIKDVQATTRERANTSATQVAAFRVLARALEKLGRYEEARDRYQDAIWIAREVFGDLNAPTLAVTADYNRFQLESVNLSETSAQIIAVGLTKLIDSALVHRTRFHPEILTLRELRARAFLRAGKQQESGNEFQNCTSDTVSRFGPDSPEALDARMRLALWQVATGEARGGAWQLEKLYKYYCDNFGLVNAETRFIQFHLGFAKRDSFVEAEKLMKDAIEGLRLVAGEDHEWTLRAMDGLANFYRLTGVDGTGKPPSITVADSATPKWTPALQPSDIVSLRVLVHLRRASRQSAESNILAAVNELDAAIKALDFDTFLNEGPRNLMTQKALGMRAFCRKQLGQINGAMADDERKLILQRESMAGDQGPVNHRALAISLIDAGVSRGNLGWSYAALDALTESVVILRQLSGGALDDEYTWRAIMNANGALLSLAFDQVRRMKPDDSSQTNWFEIARNAQPLVKLAGEKLQSRKQFTEFDGIFMDASLDNYSRCMGLEAHSTEVKP
jgi:serine/threonine protein kinase